MENNIGKQIINNDPVLKRMTASNHFMMRQHSDVTDANIFDHVTYVGTETVEDILSHDFPSVEKPNTLMEHSYIQLFIDEDTFDKNKELFDDDKKGANYKVISQLGDCLNGFIRNENFFILINAENMDGKYGVYAMIDGINDQKTNYICNNADINIPFIGFINIGYLIDIHGYEAEALQKFETEVGFTIPPAIKNYLQHSSIVKFKNKIYHIDLNNYNESVKTKSAFKTKAVSNSESLRNMTDEDKSIQSITDNSEFIKNMANGFLYIGMINKIMLSMASEEDIIVRHDKLYILMNYEEVRGIDFSFTLWHYCHLNMNAKKLLNMYVESNSHLDAKDFNRKENKMDLHDPTKTMFSMKFVQDL